jgi:hypothetical protein
MAKVDDSVMFVLGHGDACPELGTVFHNKLPCRYILILQITRVALSTQLSQTRITLRGVYARRWQEASEMEGILSTLVQYETLTYEVRRRRDRRRKHISFARLHIVNDPAGNWRG